MMPITYANRTIKYIYMFDLFQLVGSLEFHVFQWIVLLKIAKIIPQK